ncbi:MAG: GNAT family N-acetyltransferase [Cellulomonadaceae bacterium]|jgi:ribosomal-protein-alanine N-acetyltransferase|nr:GNAT family N-acetyltransferase [Cellulomonadaceae bacterium]
MKSQFWPVTLRQATPFGLIRLRPLQMKDEGAWQRLRSANISWLQPWEATSPLPPKKRKLSYRQFVLNNNKSAKEGVVLPWVIEFDGQIVGQVTVAAIAYGSLHSASIGYFISKHVAGKGIVPIAVAMAVDYLFAYRSIHRIEINIRPENAASLRVVEKLGFREEGLRTGFLHIAGKWADHRCFALTQEEVPGGLLPRVKAAWA